jgi:hypothetical protein
LLTRRHLSQSIGEKPLGMGDIRVNVRQSIVVAFDGRHCRLDSLPTKVFL